MDSSKASKNFYCFGFYLQQYENTFKKFLNLYTAFNDCSKDFLIVVYDMHSN